jgi:hypothetical protein
VAEEGSSWFGRQRLFHKPEDDAAFEFIVEETLAKQPMRICSDGLSPNHWHFGLWLEHDGHLAAFRRRLGVTHVTRWQKHRHRVGEGHASRRESQIERWDECRMVLPMPYFLPIAST